MPVITTNVAALATLRYTNINTNQQTRYLTQLSSGSRVASAADDAASLAIGSKLKSDAASLTQASTNAANAIALLNTADGGASQIGDILQRLKVLATEAQSGSVDTTSQGNIDKEYQALLTEIGNISSGTKFNGTALIASGGSTNSFLLGLSGSTDTVTVTLTGSDATTLGINSTAVTSTSGASAASTAIDTAISTLSGLRAKIGAGLAQVQYQQNYVNTAQQNAAAGASNLLDADVAQVQSQFNNVQVLTEAGIAAIQKANSIPQELLSLLKS